MTTPSQISSDHTRQCAVFEERLSAWLEGELDDDARSMMDRHRAECLSCAALVADIDEIVHEAKSLPPLTPSRDLWRGIEARLGAPVISLESRREEAVVRAPARQGGVSVRWFAVAATMLMAVSSGVTWMVARERFDVPSSGAVASGSVASGAGAVTPGSSSPSSGNANGNAGVSPRPAGDVTAPSVASTSVASVPGTPSATGNVAARHVANSTSDGGAIVRPASSMREVDAIYEREIAALRRIVDQRFAELDPETVAALRENLRMIDKAILDSRRALQRDPNSGLLSTELDRTLEAKLDLMRRVALL